MNHNEHHHSSGFMNGFLFGLIIGAAVVFFLFTDKGKRLLKTITEEGIEGIADIQDLVSDEMDDEEEESYDESEEEPHQQKASHTHVEPLHDVETGQRPSKVKRFFRGIKRG